MLRKEVQSQTKSDIIRALLKRSRFPDLLVKEEGAHSQSAKKLNKIHEANLQARRKAYNAYRLTEEQSAQKRKRYEEELKRQQKYLKDLTTQKLRSKKESFLMEEHQRQEAKSKYKQQNVDKRRKILNEHSQLLKKLELAQQFKISKSVPHYSSEVFENSIRLKNKKIKEQLEHSRRAESRSLEKQQQSKRILQQQQQQRRSKLGRLDKRLNEAQQNAEKKQEERYKSVVQKCVKSMERSSQKINQNIKNTMAMVDYQMKQYDEKRQKVIKNLKSHFLLNSKAKKQDVELTFTKISKAKQERQKKHSIHLQNHKQKRQKELKVLRTSFRQNEQFIRKKVALQEKTLKKQYQLSRFKQQFEKGRQQAISDHYMNRSILSTDVSTELLR